MQFQVGVKCFAPRSDLSFKSPQQRYSLRVPAQTWLHLPGAGALSDVPQTRFQKSSLFQGLSIVVQTPIFRVGKAPPECRSHSAKGQYLSRDWGECSPSGYRWEDGAAGISELSPAPRRTRLLWMSLGNCE